MLISVFRLFLFLGYGFYIAFFYFLLNSFESITAKSLVVILFVWFTVSFIRSLFYSRKFLSDILKKLKKSFHILEGSDIDKIVPLKEGIIVSAPRYKLIFITSIVFSAKNQKEVFEPIITDWDNEIFEIEAKKEIWKARWINVRYTYAFILAIWQKSPIGDFIEFVIKIAKG